MVDPAIDRAGGFRATILTVIQAAQLLHFEPATIRRLAARGEIPARKVAGAWRFHQEQLEAFIREGQPSRYLGPQAAHAASVDPLSGPDSAAAVAKFAARAASIKGPAE